MAAPRGLPAARRDALEPDEDNVQTTTFRPSVERVCSCAMAPTIIRDGVIFCAACNGLPRVPAATSGYPRPFSQLDGERPAGCGRIKYLRVWRRARDAGDEGATVDGRARLMTIEAYARHSKIAIRRRPKSTIDVDPLLLEALGAGPRGAS